MGAKDLKYRQFLHLLAKRKQTIDSIAAAMNDTALVPVKGKTGEFHVISRGRCALNRVLLGMRSGKPTWVKLRDVLTKAEYDLIYEYASERHARLSAEGKVTVSEFIKHRVP